MSRVAEDLITIAQELAEVTRLVEADDVPSALDRFVSRVVATVPSCAEASIAVLEAGSPVVVARSYAAAGSPADTAREALATQLVAPGGPLNDVLNYGEPHRIGDTVTDHRWPAFAAMALSAGYRSCLLLPLPAKGEAAAFTLMSTEAEAFGETSYDVVLLFALHAGVVFDNVQLFHDSRELVAQLQTALGTRAMIGRAQGILMHRYDIGGTIAFQVLARGSQTTNVKLRDLAAEIVESQEKGELTAALARYGIVAGPDEDELTP
jgi:GAF domain-containing protein